MLHDLNNYFLRLCYINVKCLSNILSIVSFARIVPAYIIGLSTCFLTIYVLKVKNIYFSLRDKNVFLQFAPYKWVL